MEVIAVTVLMVLNLQHGNHQHGSNAVKPTSQMLIRRQNMSFLKA
jgi:hypothetical protein